MYKQLDKKENAIAIKKNAVRNQLKKMGLLTREGLNEYLNYQYFTEAQFKQLFIKLLTKFKLDLQPTIERVEIFDGTEKRPFGRIVYVNFRLVDVETGWYEESVFIGESISNNGTGVATAITGALKSYLANTFLVATGDDPEREAPERSDTINSKQMTPEQMNIISGLPEEVKARILAQYGTLELTTRDASICINKLKTEGII